MADRKRRFAFVAPKVVPGVGVEPPSPIRERRFAVVDPNRISHAAVREFYLANPHGGQLPDDFNCENPRCIGMLVDGKVHHAWFCSWWDLPENKMKTPF